MKKPSFSSRLVKKQIEEASTTNNWESLEPLLLPEEIARLSTSDRETLAEIFYTKGEHLLKNFEEVDQMEKAFFPLELAIKLDPSMIKAWLSLAQVNLTLGLHQGKIEFATRAHELFSHLEQMYSIQDEKLSPEILWDWGSCLYYIAKDSEEAIDFKYAIEKFSQADTLGLQHPSFYLDYGIALGEFGVCTGQKELLIKATQYLEKSISANSDNGSAWLQMACAYKVLYFFSNDVSYFEKSDQSFLSAVRLNVDQATLWINWGQLLAAEGKIIRDEDLLRSALDKLEKAVQILPTEPIVLCTLADTLMHLSALSDQFELLKEAQEKLTLAYKLNPENPDTLCLWGHCFVYMGKYFSDQAYIQLGIEKFQLGLSQNKKAALFWHGLATAHFALGDFKQEIDEYEKAAKFSAHSIRLSVDNPGYWNDWGVALMKMGELSQESKHIVAAAEKFEYAIRLFHRKHPGSPDPDWVYNYACSLDYLGDAENNPHLYERAIAILAHLLEQYPNFQHIRYNLALSLYHLGDALGEAEILEKSIGHFEALIEKETEDDGILNDLGLAYLTIGYIYRDSFDNSRSTAALQNAEKYFLQALSLGNIESNYWIANLYALNENFADAMHFFERAKTQDALPTLNEILENDWLIALRQTARFRAFLAELSDSD